jgi:2-polyprenyl-3-methyl-5-hydroxy-6-metoxy-1,4-benzoquinol methylase
VSWWVDLYDDLLADVFLERTDSSELERTARFLIEGLELPVGAEVFDQCCGIGSIALELSAAGFSVLGVDQAARYVERARTEAERRSLGARFVAADAFEFVPDRPVRGAFNWWTSFGYAAEDDRNRAMLERAFEALEPGGWFMLDTMNLASLLRGFLPEVITSRATPDGTVTLRRLSELDLASGVMHKRWIYELPGGRRVERPSSVRVYSADALLEMFRRVGFVELAAFGGIDRSPLGLDSPRCILRGRRPAR